MEKIVHNIKKIFLLKPVLGVIIILALSFCINIAFAGTQPGGGANIENPLDKDTFYGLILEIAQIVMEIGLAVAVIFIIYAGFLFVSARGSEEQLKKAKKTFMWAVIGTAILLGAVVITEAIKGTIDAISSDAS
ncbi:MAG: TrbC/VirB2 family protein [Patescibacteria group bacterium]|nr:pilin [Patescibacteria group bacterium]